MGRRGGRWRREGGDGLGFLRGLKGERGKEQVGGTIVRCEVGHERLTFLWWSNQEEDNVRRGSSRRGTARWRWARERGEDGPKRGRAQERG
jgi:hypothetical protein